MGLLDDAKDKLGDAAEWVKDKAEHLGDQAQGAGQSLGERAADARHWVGSRVGSDAESGDLVGGGGTFGGPSDDASPDAPATDTTAAPAPAVPSPAEEWVEVTSDGSTVDADASGSVTGAPSGAAGILDDEPEQDRSI